MSRLAVRDERLVTHSLPKRERRRICIYDPISPGPGGLSRYVQGIIRGLSPDEFDVTVVALNDRIYRVNEGTRVIPIGAESQELTWENAPSQAASPNAESRSAIALGWRKLAPRSIRHTAGFLKSARGMASLLKKEEFDLIHSFECGADTAVVAARIAGVPIRLTTFQVDSTYFPEDSRRWSTWMNEVIADRCTTLAIAASEVTRQDRIRRTGIAADKVLTIHNGVDTDHFQRCQTRAEARKQFRLPDDAVIVGGLGRLHEHKGFEYLIHAAAVLRADCPNLIVAIGGSGELRSRLEGLAVELGVQDRVRLLGQIHDVRGFLECLDVFALPSLCEALPYALLEAMSMGLPAVATRVGGVAELVDEGQSGFVIEARRTDQLVSALHPLLQSADLRQRIGAAARTRVVESFHESDRIANHVAVYRELLDRHVRK